MANFLNVTNILLADDDIDDSYLFKNILDELPLHTHLTTLFNGDQLMKLLNEKLSDLPDVLFLDLNMPRKNGFDCLIEIKRSEKLKSLPVIILTTSFDPEVVKLLYRNGAQYYIRKPNSYWQLKKDIHNALILTAKTEKKTPLWEEFILSG